MKRDMDYITQLLREFEESNSDRLFLFTGTAENSKKKRYHYMLLCGQNMIEKLDDSAYRITIMGHDYLACERKGFIGKVKDSLGDKFESTPLKTIFSSAMDLYMDQYREDVLQPVGAHRTGILDGNVDVILDANIKEMVNK